MPFKGNFRVKKIQSIWFKSFHILETFYKVANDSKKKVCVFFVDIIPSKCQMGLFIFLLSDVPSHVRNYTTFNFLMVKHK